jgi:GT2 family glycosyltransferase
MENITEEDLKKGPQYVDYAATGMMLIHRDVIEKINPPWFQVTNLERGQVFPEDFAICRKAREAGFKVAVDPRFDTWHFMPTGKRHTIT